MAHPSRAVGTSSTKRWTWSWATPSDARPIPDQRTARRHDPMVSRTSHGSPLARGGFRPVHATSDSALRSSRRPGLLCRGRSLPIWRDLIHLGRHFSSPHDHPGTRSWEKQRKGDIDPERQKPGFSGGFCSNSGNGIRTRDLRVMSPTRSAQFQQMRGILEDVTARKYGVFRPVR